MHRAKFVNLELSVLHSGAVLHVKERTGRLQSVRDENNHSQHRKDDEHDGSGIAVTIARLRKRFSGFSRGFSRQPINRKPPSLKWVTEWGNRCWRSLKVVKSVPRW